MRQYASSGNCIYEMTRAKSWQYDQILKGRERYRRACVKNPLIAQRYEDTNNTIYYHKQIAADAWGYFYSMESAPQAFRDYYMQYIDPLVPERDALLKALYCRHTHTDYGDDCQVCLDCGAEDHGLGWDYFFHAPIITTNNAAATQGHERGLKWDR